MRVYLIRHGKAERSSRSGRDEDRVLAPRGRRQAAWLADQLRDTPEAPGRILASPAARTTETAGILAEALGIPLDHRAEIGLAASPSDVVHLIATEAGLQTLALVGHNPTLSVVASVLTRGHGGGGLIELRTGQAAVIDLIQPNDPLGNATLVSLLRLEE